jgi:hypothetical protein
MYCKKLRDKKRSKTPKIYATLGLILKSPNPLFSDFQVRPPSADEYTPSSEVPTYRMSIVLSRSMANAEGIPLGGPASLTQLDLSQRHNPSLAATYTL